MTRMRVRFWLSILGAALGGCASVSDLFLPAPAVAQRPAVVDEEPVVVAPR